MSSNSSDTTQMAQADNPKSKIQNPKYEGLSYRYPVERLWSGGSYGNMACFARTDRLSNLDGFWQAGTNEWLCGTLALDVRLETDGSPLRADETTFYPGHQATTLTGDKVWGEKTVFVPYGEGSGVRGQGSVRSATVPTASRLYMVLRLRAEASVEVRVNCDVRWPATASTSHTKQPERHHIQRRVRQWMEGSTLWAETVPFRVDRWDTVLGNGDEVRALLCPEGGEVTFSEPGRAQLSYLVRLVAGETATLSFVLVTSTTGIDDLRGGLGMLPGWEEALDGTIQAYEELLGNTLILTPDALINRGLQWAKANTVRVQHRYRQGIGFTNDPPQDIVVVRDCAWYGLGADWLTPDFTQAMYDLILQHGVHEGGKLTEYIHADTGQRDDYALNINDDTPLFVVGVLHHYAVSGDLDFLRRAYPAVRQACEWILAQRQGGLVWCTTEGADIWGNATWRNIIPGYRLAGAVTEINALCHQALLAGSLLSEEAGVGEQGSGVSNDLRYEPTPDSRRWRAAAGELREAINSQLATEEGAYLLNLDTGGKNPTLTADLIFPILGGVADPDRARHILDLLYSPIFYTPYGIHTVARGEAEHHPNFGHGLMGGLWPNLTAWVAYAGRHFYPDRLVEMMDGIYALCEIEDPKAEGHLVPGEFPEWFDGETFESRGMAMSPWMPPTYLWLGVEGLAGVTPGPGGLAITPNLPAHWGWLAVRNLPFRGERISLFVHEGHLHTTQPVQSLLPQVQYTGDVTEEVEVEDGLLVIALQSDNYTTILVAAQEAAEGVIRFRGNSQKVNLIAGEATLIRWEKGD